jgi:hypothetical protein
MSLHSQTSAQAIRASDTSDAPRTHVQHPIPPPDISSIHPNEPHPIQLHQALPTWTSWLSLLDSTLVIMSDANTLHQLSTGSSCIRTDHMCQQNAGHRRADNIAVQPHQLDASASSMGSKCARRCMCMAAATLTADIHEQCTGPDTCDW